MGKGRRSFNIVLGAALLAWLLAWAAPTATAGPNLAVRVDEPFEVNGTVYPAGTLHLKSRGDYSPTQTIHELWLDDTCLGVLLARRGELEVQEPLDDTLIFLRSPAGHLVLAGSTLAGPGNGESFRYQPGSDGTDRPFTAASLR